MRDPDAAVEEELDLEAVGARSEVFRDVLPGHGRPVAGSRMQFHTDCRRRFDRQSLCEQCRNDASEHIAHTRCRHTRIAGGTDKRHIAGCRYQRSGAFQDGRTAVFSL